MEDNSNFVSENIDNQPNWQREALTQWWQPSRQLLKAIRSYQNWQTKGGLLGNLICTINIVEFRFWSVVCGCDIPINSQIGGGLILPHPTGVVIHPKSTIGINCTIFQQVTIVGSVKVGNNVLIGAGAKILARTTLEDHVRIGANAVVKKMTIPANSTVVGIPGKILAPKAGSPTLSALDAES
ncbi:MAG: serine O-acetyltransferase [Synechocystis sp.]|jgi:serine O-acetyltransferase